jgi:hypothetical protein
MPRVARLVDLAHPARAQRREDLVGPKAGTYRQRHAATSPLTPTLSPAGRGRKIPPRRAARESRMGGGGNPPRVSSPTESQVPSVWALAMSRVPHRREPRRGQLTAEQSTAEGVRGSGLRSHGARHHSLRSERPRITVDRAMP